MTGRAVLARFLLAAVLAATTLLLYLGIGRFVLAGPDLLPPLLGEAGELHDAWESHGDVLPEETGTLILTNTEPVGQASVSRMLEVPEDAAYLTLSAEIALQDVIGGRDLWHRARIILPSRQRDGGPGAWRYDLPHTLVRREGRTGWTGVEATFQVPPGSEVLVAVQLLRATGRFRLRDLSLREAQEKSWFPLASRLLACAWLVAALWILWPLLRPIPAGLWQRWPDGQQVRILAVLVTVTAIAGAAVAPSGAKQHLRDLLLPSTSIGASSAAPSPGEAAGPVVSGPAIGSEFLAPRRLHWLIVDKGGHLAGFAALAFLACWAAAGQRGGGRREAVRRVAMVVAALLGFAVLTEIWQVMAENRGASRSDVAINAIGLLLGLLAWAALDLTRRRLFR